MRVLIADDESAWVAGLAQFLQKGGHEVCAVTTSGLDVLPAYDRFRPDIVLMDVLMPRFDGISIAKALLGRHPEARLVLCSGALSADHPFIAGSGACHFLRKPFTFSEAAHILESLAQPRMAA
jgi:two-component system chemotaxis response regulator CheY